MTVENGTNQSEKTQVDNDIDVSDDDRLTKEEPNICENKWLLFKIILIGQIISMSISGLGTSVTTLSSIYNIHTPCFNIFTTYVLLAFTFGIYTVTRRRFISLVHAHGWKYLVVALLDAEGNYLLYKSFSYTTLTSALLCMSFNIPTIILMSFIFLRIRYKCIHYIGATLCVSGAICLVLIDRKDKTAPNEVLGDVMALMAAVCVGMAQVCQEFLVKNYSWKDYLGMTGIIGSVILGIQTLAVEYHEITHIPLDWKIVLLFGALSSCGYIYYVLIPNFMKLSSATIVNLSLLSNNFYNLLIGLLLFGYKFSYMYFIALCGIIAGLVIYNLKPTYTALPKKKTNAKYDSDARSVNEKRYQTFE